MKQSEEMQRFLKREDVEYFTGLPTSTIYEMMGRNDFPKPIPITPRRVVWLEADLIEWQKRKIAEARPII